MEERERCYSFIMSRTRDEYRDNMTNYGTKGYRCRKTKHNAIFMLAAKLIY
jgi:hypothetical protein